MGQRVIPVAVTAEYIGGDGVTLGAAGSHNSVVIEYDFRAAGPMWDDPEDGTLIKYVLWTNPQGNTTNRVDLGVDKLVDGYDGKLYHASPTADAMCVAGWAEMVVVGAVISDGKEVAKVKTEPSRFRVLPGSSRAADNEGLAATVADQLQREIEAVHQDLKDDVADLEDRKVNKPDGGYSPDGVAGQVLESLGDGKTRWVDPAIATPEVVEEVLEDHQDWVTTVQDRSISERKLTTQMESKVNGTYVYGNVAFLWCPVDESGMNSAGTEHQQFGLSCVLWNNNACIVYDFGNSLDPGHALISFLEGNGITKVDAVIISHYHGDHVKAEAVEALLDSNVDTSDCVFYLPHHGLDWTQIQSDTTVGMAKIEADIQDLLEARGKTVIYPETEGYFAQIGDFRVNLYNVSHSFWGDYYAWKYRARQGTIESLPRYNNWSMCALVSIGGTRVFLTGDIERPAQDNMADIVAEADVISLPHHGVNLVESPAFIRAINTKIGVLSPYSYKRYQQISGEISPITEKCLQCGTVLTTQNGNVELVIDGGGVHAADNGGLISGVSLGQTIRQNSNMDDLDFGFSVYPSTNITGVTNLPSAFNRTSYFLTVPINLNATDEKDMSYGKLQFGFCPTGDKEGTLVYRRRKAEGTWTDWININLITEAHDSYTQGDTEYFTRKMTQSMRLSPISVRGDLKATEISDCNACTTTGFYTLNLASRILNGPWRAGSAGYMIVMSHRNSQGLKRCVQIAFRMDLISENKPYIYVRNYSEGAETPWSEWRRTMELMPTSTPALPSAAGTYVLTATVTSGGEASFQWVAQ